MKTLITSFVFLIGSAVVAQAPDCVVFPAGPNDFNNATTFPAGSTLFTSAGIDVIKPSASFGIYPMPGFQYISNTANEMYYINQLDLDLSNLTYTCKKLTFDLLFNGFAVDADTIFVNGSGLPTFPYVGVGFTVDTSSAGSYIISGDFNMIHTFGSTTAISNICVQPCPAQNCFQFPVVAGDYNNATTYPAGSTLISSAGIDIVKPTTGFGIYPMPGFQFIGITSNQFYFINQLDLDVSSLPYTCKKLTFYLAYNGIAVDTDTIFTPGGALPALPYAGVGFTLDTISMGNYVITGDFSAVHIFGSTSILSDICVEECIGGSCFEFPASSTENFNDNMLYPAGSVLLSSNGIDLIKPTAGFGIYPSPGSQIIGVNANEILFINQLDIDVSGLNYACKELTFELIYNGFAVDNDTVFVGSFALPIFPYNGPDFTVDTLSANVYQVTGDFDAIHIFGSTTILSNICVEPCTTGGCFELPVNSTENFNDNMLYPAGSVLLSSNGIDIVKPTAGFGIYPTPGCQIIDVTSTEILFINQLDIDVSAVTFACKKLTFDLIYNGFAVDNDTIFVGTFALPTFPYVGVGFTVDTLSANVYVVSGDFDIIHIFGSTAILSDICIEPCSVVATEEVEMMDLEIYPNPAHDIVNINWAVNTSAQINLYDLTGKLVYQNLEIGTSTQIDLSNFNTGIYLIEIISDEERFTRKIVKE